MKLLFTIFFFAVAECKWMKGHGSKEDSRSQSRHGVQFRNTHQELWNFDWQLNEITPRYLSPQVAEASEKERHPKPRVQREKYLDPFMLESMPVTSKVLALTGNHRETGDIDPPPDHKKYIAMARYVLHNTIWCSIATISSLPAIRGFPFANVKSFVDGTEANSTGIPYFYMAPADFTARDLMKNSRTTILVSLEETGFCAKQKMDPQDPRCTRLMISGKMKKVRPGTSEYNFAKSALFERHPDMANYPTDHNFFVAKLKIAQIAMVDWFGGAKYISVKDYLAYNYTVVDETQFFYKPIQSEISVRTEITDVNTAKP